MERFKEVTSSILRGGAPSDGEIYVLKTIWNVNRIVSLDEEVGEQIKPTCNKLKIEQIIVPISYDSKDVLQFLSSNIVPLLTQNPSVYVHCLHGRDRTGLAVALFRIKKQGWSVKKALEEALSMDFGKGLQLETLNQFINVIKQAKEEDVSSADAVDQVRTSLLDGNSGGTINGSYFSSILPIPGLDQGSSDDKKRKRRKKMRQLYLQDRNDAMAYVGQNDGLNPVLRGISPDGAGPMGMLPPSSYYF